VGGGQQILAASDVGDLLEGVVHDDGEMIGGADVLAGGRPSDEPGFTVVRDDSHLIRGCRDHLLVVRIVAAQRL